MILFSRQSAVKDKFRFVTFCIQFAVYLVELVLSVIPERIPHSRGSYHLQQDGEVREGREKRENKREGGGEEGGGGVR